MALTRRRPATPTRSDELRELEALYDRVVPGPFLEGVEGFVEDIVDALDSELTAPMRGALLSIVAGERSFPRPDFAHLDLVQQVELKARLKKWELRRIDGEDLAHEYFLLVFGRLARVLPRTETPTPFTIPLIYAVPEPRAFLKELILTHFDASLRDRDLFEDLSDQLYLNLCHASGIDPRSDVKKKYRFPTEDTGSLADLIHTYFRMTPFLDLFLAPVPLKLSIEDRFNHMHVIGGTGAGKTTLIENLILHDLRSDDPPSLVVIDPHSDLIRKLTRADLGIEDRLIIIDPRDVKHPPALNMFDVKRDRFGGYDEATREQVTAGVIDTLDYLLTNLFDLKLTGKQAGFFRYILRLMLTFPEVRDENATILDMLALMKGKEPFADVIAALPDIPREFFEHDFSETIYKETRAQVRYRLQALIENPTLARLFTSKETKIDFFAELNRGTVVLVDTARDFLKANSSVYGRILIALIQQAILERAAVPGAERKPTFLIVDEAASYFDDNIDDLLTEARKYRCGLVLAHQYLDQAKGGLRASLAANTGIKFASGLSAGDARAMAPEMRTTPDFILSQPKLQFAAHIRHVTPQAVSIPVRPVTDLPQLSREAYAALLERNRERVALEPAAQPPSPAPRPPDEDFSTE